MSDLSADLIRNGFRIVNGYGLGLGNEVIAGALQELKKLHKPVENNLIIRPFPQGIADRAMLWPIYRKEMISMTGVSLFFIGNKYDDATKTQINSPGVRNEYEISKEHDNFLVPVGMTGSMAEELYKEQMVDIRAGGTIYDDYKNVFEDLGDKTKSLDEIRSTIISLLVKINE